MRSVRITRQSAGTDSNLYRLSAHLLYSPIVWYGALVVKSCELLIIFSTTMIMIVIIQLRVVYCDNVKYNVNFTAQRACIRQLSEFA